MSEIRSQATPAYKAVANRRAATHALHHDLIDGGPKIDAKFSDIHHMAGNAIKAGWSKPRTVNSATELDALPVGSVIRSEDVTALKARNGAWLWDDGNYWEPLAGREVRVLFTPGEAG